MRTLLLRNFVQGPLTEPAPAVDDAALDEKIRLATGKTPNPTQRSIARLRSSSAIARKRSVAVCSTMRT